MLTLRYTWYPLGAICKFKTADARTKLKHLYPILNF